MFLQVVAVRVNHIGGTLSQCKLMIFLGTNAAVAACLVALHRVKACLWMSV